MDPTKLNASELQWQIYGFHAHEHWADNQWCTFPKSTVATLVGRFSSSGKAFRWTGATDTRRAHHSCSIRWILLWRWTSIGRMGILCAERRWWHWQEIFFECQDLVWWDHFSRWPFGLEQWIQRQLTWQPKIMLGSTMRVDGRLDANTAFRVEALGCLIIPIIICLAKEFIQQTQSLRVRHTCDNQGLVDQLSQMYKQERYHTIPDTADNDLAIPTAHWVKKNNSRLIWQQGHAEWREQDATKWTNDEWANG